jgi:hypothetical protein
MSNAISAHGTLISRNGTTIGEVRDITPPPRQRNTFEVTTQNDSDDSYVVGIRRKGEMTFKVNWLVSGDVTHGPSSGLQSAYANGSKDTYKVTYPDSSSELFSGFLTNLAIGAPVDGELAADITIRPTGGSIYVP